MPVRKPTNIYAVKISYTELASSVLSDEQVLILFDRGSILQKDFVAVAVTKILV